MDKKRKHLIVTALLFSAVGVLIIVLGRGLTVDPNKVPSALLGKKAMAFNVSWLQGQSFLATKDPQRVTLADTHGKPMVLNFWASWCVSCRTEAKDLEAVWMKYKSQGLVVLGIAIQDEKPAAISFAEKYGKTYLLALDEDGKASIDYGVHGVPETFLVDRNGTIVHKEAGPVTVAMLEKLLPKIL